MKTVSVLLVVNVAIISLSIIEKPVIAKSAELILNEIEQNTHSLTKLEGLTYNRKDGKEYRPTWLELTFIHVNSKEAIGLNRLEAVKTLPIFVLDSIFNLKQHYVDYIYDGSDFPYSGGKRFDQTKDGLKEIKLPGGSKNLENHIREFNYYFNKSKSIPKDSILNNQKILSTFTNYKQRTDKSKYFQLIISKLKINYKKFNGENLLTIGELDHIASSKIKVPFFDILLDSNKAIIIITVIVLFTCLLQWNFSGQLEKLIEQQPIQSDHYLFYGNKLSMILFVLWIITPPILSLFSFIIDISFIKIIILIASLISSLKLANMIVNLYKNIT